MEKIAIYDDDATVLYSGKSLSNADAPTYTYINAAPRKSDVEILDDKITSLKTEMTVLKEKVEFYEKSFERVLDAVNKFVEILEESNK